MIMVLSASSVYLNGIVIINPPPCIYASFLYQMIILQIFGSGDQGSKDQIV